MTGIPEGRDVATASLRDKDPNNPWLAAEDIYDAPIVVVITKVQEVRGVTLENGRKEDVLVLHLASKKGRALSKALILSKTNIRALNVGLGHGKKCVNWIGVEIGLWCAELKKRTFDRYYGIRIAVDDPRWIDKTIVGDGKLPEAVKRALGAKRGDRADG
jgi:hypothetical protein